MKSKIRYLKWIITNKSKNNNINIHYTVNLNKGTKLDHYVKIHRSSSIQDTTINEGTYLGWNCIYNNCNIGKYCSIAPYSEVVYGRHPSKKYVSIHPAFYSLRKQAGFTLVDKQKYEEFKFFNKDKKISVKIGNDVWIGYGAKIMEGVKIDNGAIVAAGALVVNDVPAYAIVGGIPATILKYRFREEEIKFLLDLQWWNKSEEWIKSHAKYFDDIENLRKALDYENKI
ncbi:CatB-related O-acetyltransferase [Clostridium sp. YIM B02506]|uniref:CatB-related O-acetyltransferase n=1 Tax=Clostridium sp. YIM B02506 TaxID=2910680 RepID=UPI001EEE1B0C|nr:CatB-related O-acetyltransferase [Clostridium sp. YIM B02506]